MRKSKIPFSNPYSLESEMCDILIEKARANGWKAYPETNGFDLFLVRNDVQMGIQAKLRANIDVLYQAFTNQNCNICAVLVPRASIEFIVIAHALKIFVIEAASLNYNLQQNEFNWTKHIRANLDDARIHSKFAEQQWIPPTEVNIKAGAKSPKLLTPWKFKAVALCIELNKKGWVTSQDFKRIGLSMTIWIVKKWLTKSPEKYGKYHKYHRNANVNLPDQIYPEITEVLLKPTK